MIKLHKKHFMLLGALAVLLIVVGVTILVTQKHTTKTGGTFEKKALPTLAELRKNNAPMSTESAGLADLSIAQASYIAKDYTAAVTKSKAVFANDKLSAASRVQAMVICIMAAKADGNATETNDCKTKAENLLAASASLPSDQKSYYQVSIKYALGEAKATDFGGSSAGR